MNDQRESLLQDWAHALDRAARSGALTGDANKPIVIKAIDWIAGPRAGALEISAGLDTGRLLRSLSADDGAVLRQFITWAFPYSPAVYLSGRAVRCEAGWPDHLAERSVKVSDLNTRPNGSGRWACGKNELGRTVNLSIDDQKPHWLIAGTTGSGKSVALRSMVTQLAQHGDQTILLDGKYGEGLRGLEHLPNVIGPLAADVDAARSALAWAVQEMTRRYEQADGHAPRLVIVIDEVQEFSDDAAIVEMIRRLAAQGRAANVSIILATQHPTIAAFGDATTKRNVTGRIALRVADAKSSEVAIGQSTPRADWLLGAGDAYAVTPGHCERTQIAFMPKPEIDRLLTSTPAIAEWPVFVAETALPDGWPNGDEIGAAIVSASRDEGRVKFVRALKAAGLPGMSPERAVKVLRLGHDALDYLEHQKVFVRSRTQTPKPTKPNAEQTRRGCLSASPNERTG